MTADCPSQIIRLSEGTLVNLREAQAEDAPRLAAMHARLSQHTLYMRYLSATARLTEREARKLCEDFAGAHVVLVAALVDSPDTLVAVAVCALRDPAQAQVAEIAIVVEDGYQRRGLGKAMLHGLVATAYQQGIRTVLAFVHCRNEQVTHFVQRSGFRVERTVAGNVCEYRIHLDRETIEREPDDEMPAPVPG